MTCHWMNVRALRTSMQNTLQPVRGLESTEPQDSPRKAPDSSPQQKRTIGLTLPRTGMGSFGSPSGLGRSPFGG